MSENNKTVASYIDHTLLKADATASMFDALCDEALAYSFASVCVPGKWVGHVVNRLQGRIPVCAVAGFPLGSMKSTVKAIEATSAIKDGANEVDFVAHLPDLLAADVDALRRDFLEVTTAVRAALPQAIVKVILETSAIMASVAHATAEKRIAAGCQAARESGCDFVKTSTGFHPTGGATVEAVNIMRTYAGSLHIKASGGIRSLADAEQYIALGATRLGCSAGVAICQGQSVKGVY